MPGHFEQTGRSIKRPPVLFIEQWRFFASKRSGNGVSIAAGLIL
jgi:hypothetical protein